LRLDLRQVASEQMSYSSYGVINAHSFDSLRSFRFLKSKGESPRELK